MKRIRMRLIAILLVLMQVVSIIPLNALAEGSVVNYIITYPEELDKSNLWIVAGTGKGDNQAIALSSITSGSAYQFSWVDTVLSGTIRFALKFAYSSESAVEDEDVQYQRETIVSNDKTEGALNNGSYIAKWSTATANSFSISINEAPQTKLSIRMNFDGTNKTVHQDMNYYLFVKAVKSNGTTAYRLLRLPETEGQNLETIEIDNWQDQDGNILTGENTFRFDGTESVTVEIRQIGRKETSYNMNAAINTSNGKVLVNGDSLENYTVSYGTELEHVEPTEEDPINRYYYDINLTENNVSQSYNYQEILGAGLYYGMTANELYQNNDLQTNFAVNSYSRSNHGITPDLSGSSSGIVVAGVINGTMKLNGPAGGEAVIYTSSIDPSYFEPGLGTVHKVYDSAENLARDIVNPIISHGAYYSGVLNQTANMKPVIANNDYFSIDTRAYPSNATIFIDADAFVDKLSGTTDGLEIHKQENQTIVFNIRSKKNFKICQYVVNGESTDTKTAQGADGGKNLNVEPIAKHIVWNVITEGANVELDTMAGIVLVPNGNVTITGAACAGWIIAGGKISNDAEWHNIYSSMPAITQAVVNAKKTVNNVNANNQEVFRFTVERYAANSVGNRQWIEVGTETNEGSAIEFRELEVPDVGWNVFRLTETEIVEVPDGSYTYTIETNRKYYAGVYVTRITSESNGQEIEYRVASSARYYNDFSEGLYNASADIGKPEDTGLTNQVVRIDSKGNTVADIPTFNNSKTETEDTWISVKKTWNDSNDQDGKRKDVHAQVKLYKTVGETTTLVDTVDVAITDDWSKTWSPLPVYENGEAITYSIEETLSDETDYTSSLGEGQTVVANGSSTEITNSYNVEKTYATVKKIWNVEEKQDGKYPESLTVALVKDDITTDKTIVLNDANEWTGTITGLDKFRDHGTEIIYTWAEVELPAGYELTDTSVDGKITTLTNTYKLKPTKQPLEVLKIFTGRPWLDDDVFTFNLAADKNNPEGAELPKDTVQYATKDNHTAVFGDITFTKHGKFKFTITEQEGDLKDKGVTYDTEPKEFTIVVTDDGEGSLYVSDVTEAGHLVARNVYEVNGKTQFFAKKILKGRDTFNAGDFSFLLMGDTLDANGEIKPVGEDGTVSFSQIFFTEDDLDGVAVTEDAEGNKVRTKTFYYTIQEVIPEEDNEKFDPAITYDTHTENITVTITDDLKGNLDVKVNPENATAEVTFTNIVTKIEKLGNKPDGNELISVSGAHLKVLDVAPDGTAFETVDEWDTTGVPHEVINLKIDHEYTLRETVVAQYPGSDPARYYTFADDTTFTVDKNGVITYSNGLELRAEDGTLLLKDKLADQPTFEKKIKDTNDSTGVTSGWQDSADYDIGDEVPYKLTATLADNVTDYRNYHITFKDEMEKGLTFNKIEKVTLNGKEMDVDLNDEEVFTSEAQKFSLTLTWQGAANDEGKLSRIADTNLNKAEVIVYFNAILNKDAVLGYKGNVNKAKLEYSCNPNVDKNGDQIEETEETKEDSVIAFTYLLDVNKLDEGEEKEGSDELQYQPLPGATFKLEKGVITASGTVDWRTYKEFTSDQTGTKFEIKGLDDGIYKLTEEPPKGYKPVDPIIFSVTANHHDDDEWDGTDATRYSILTDLNGALYDVTTGKEITGDVSNGLITFKHLKDNEGLALDVVNKPELTSAVIRKIWDDDDNREAKRPPNLTLKLFADDVATDHTVTLDAANHWTGKISGIPMMSHGKKIKYTWAEPSVDGYTMVSNTSENGILTTLTNKYEIEKVEISVKKDWADNDNKAGVRPPSIDVQLYADGVAVGHIVTLNSADFEGNTWSYTWPKQYPKYVNENGVKREIRYSVNETEIPEGYIGKVTKTISKEDGSKITNISFKITNTYENGKLIIEKEFDIAPWEPFTPDDSPMDIPVIKTWNDNNNKDGNRPASVVVRLLANGTQVAIAELNAGNNWRYTFTGMPRIDENKERIKYTITEDPVDWYKAQINGFNIRNNYEPELTSVTVTKIWDDANNEMQARPESIVMTLSNGMTVLLNDQNNWTATINDLPTRVNGAPANYTWTEQKVLGYDKVAEVTEGSVTTFMNRRWVRPATPNRGGTPKTAGETVYEFDEYETPLGVDIVINHVGDCFD